MRQLRRPTAFVPTLRRNGPGGRLRTAQIENYEQYGTPPSNFPSHWTSPDVLGALCAMQGRVCAYCGADIEENGRDVDHFRPKKGARGDTEHGGYWWLVYDYENLLLSCTICNQKRKNNQFPLEVGATRTSFEYRDRVADERRILLNPVVDPVEDWIRVDWKKTGCRLVANPNLAPEAVARIKQVIEEIFRFNRRPAQRKKRMNIQNLVIEKIAAGKADEVRNLAIRYRPHSLVAKQILEATVPHILPTPAEELDWLLEELKKELIFKLEDLGDPLTSTELDRKECKELMWAFAIIWKDPPVGLPDAIGGFLDRNGLKEHVEEYLRLL